jgi:hypothetical protein
MCNKNENPLTKVVQDTEQTSKTNDTTQKSKRVSNTNLFKTK